MIYFSFYKFTYNHSLYMYLYCFRARNKHSHVKYVTHYFLIKVTLTNTWKPIQRQNHSLVKFVANYSITRTLWEDMKKFIKMKNYIPVIFVTKNLFKNVTYRLIPIHYKPIKKSYSTYTFSNIKKNVFCILSLSTLLINNFLNMLCKLIIFKFFLMVNFKGLNVLSIVLEKL